MSTPIADPIDDFINRRRNELLKTATTAADSATIRTDLNNTIPNMTAPVDSTQPPTGSSEDEEGFLGRVRNYVQSFLPELSPERQEIARELEEYAKDDSRMLSLLAPGGAGLTSAAGRAGVLRRTAASRMRGGKLTEELPRVAHEVAAEGGQLYEQGVKMWSNALKGPNPSEFGRILGKVPAQRLDEFRLGMLEGLVENLNNMSRLTKGAQRNLLSPAGRTMLRETLSELPDEAFTQFMALLERGQFQEWRNRAFIIASVYPMLRFAKDPILNLFK